MKIDKLILHKCDRFPLTSGTTLIYTPEQKMQLILGTNGSGKSSLLSFLTPLPPDIKNDFKEGGYKEIHITHEGHTYKLISGRLGARRHEFICDGEELNQGHTKRVFLTLVEEHFNITPEIHKLLIDEITLTAMSLKDRSKWFALLSSVSYQYVVDVYNQLKSQYRDYTGLKRRLEKKLVSLESERHTENDIKTLENNIKTLTEHIDNVSKMRYKLKTHVHDKDTLLEHIKRVESLKTKLADNVEPLEALRRRYVEKETEANLLLKSIEEIEEKVKHNKTSLMERLKTLSEEIEALEMQVPFTVKDRSLYRDFVSLIQDNATVIYDTLSTMEELFPTPPPVETIREYADKSKILLERREKLQAELTQCEHSLNHMEELSKQDSVECPKCSHTFKAGYNKQQHQNLVQRYANLKCKYDELAPQLEEASNWNVRYNDYGHYAEYLQALLDKIPQTLKYKLDLNTLPEIRSSVASVLSSVDVYNRLYMLDKEYHETKMQINNATTGDKDDLLTLKNKYEADYAKILQELRDLKAKIEASLSYEKHKKRYEDAVSELESILRGYRNTYHNKIVLKVNDVIDKLIYEDSKRLEEMKSTLNQINLKERDILQARRELKETDDRIKVLSKTIDVLSPSDGLIAESIGSFVRYVIDNMNNIIDGVWEYEMKIQMPDIENEGLSYRLPVIVSNKKTTKDVSKTSSGMKEIIDLAFKIVAMRLLGLDTYPVYLDEFGKGFDVTHKVNALRMVTRLSDMGFSQIFMISHFEHAIYNNTSNIDISIISKDNIQLASGIEYNKVLTFA